MQNFPSVKYVRATSLNQKACVMYRQHHSSFFIPSLFGRFPLFGDKFLHLNKEKKKKKLKEEEIICIHPLCNCLFFFFSEMSRNIAFLVRFLFSFKFVFVIVVVFVVVVVAVYFIVDVVAISVALVVDSIQIFFLFFCSFLTFSTLFFCRLLPFSFRHFSITS